MAIRGAKLTFVGGKKILGVQKVQVEQQAFKKNQKKVANFFLLFFLKTVKKLYFVGAPFQFSGRAPFKLVTPLISIFLGL